MGLRVVGAPSGTPVQGLVGGLSGTLPVPPTERLVGGGVEVTVGWSPESLGRPVGVLVGPGRSPGFRRRPTR